MKDKPERPLVSIITACLNSEATLEDTITGIEHQTYKNIEYIIVDGGSSDGTLKIAEAHANSISRMISEPDDGIYDAFNKGIRASSGDIVGIINSDDFYLPGAVASAVEHFFSDPSAEVVCGRMILVDENVGEWHMPPLGSHTSLPLLMSVHHPSVFIRRKSYEERGSFDKSFKICGDWELLRRFYLGGASFAAVDEPFSVFRSGGISNRIKEKMYEEDIRILEADPPTQEAEQRIKKLRKKIVSLKRRESIDRALRSVPGSSMLKECLSFIKTKLKHRRVSGMYGSLPSGHKTLWDAIMAIEKEISC